MEPAAQDSEASINTAAPMGSTRPPPTSSSGPTSKITPAKPSPSPSATPLLGRTPPGRTQSNTVIHSGDIATNKAARPDGTDCSAHTTPPFPPNNISPPTKAAAPH